jgi:hypothetical protein
MTARPIEACSAPFFHQQQFTGSGGERPQGREHHRPDEKRQEGLVGQIDRVAARDVAANNEAVNRDHDRGQAEILHGVRDDSGQCPQEGAAFQPLRQQLDGDLDSERDHDCAAEQHRHGAQRAPHIDVRQRDQTPDRQMACLHGAAPRQRSCALPARR